MRGFMIVVLVAFSQWAGAAEVVYVQAATAKMKSEAKAGSEDILTLNRGDQLEVLETKGSWIKVQSSGKTGWISKLFTSSNRPVGQAEVFKNEEVSKEKISRKRSSNYSVTAATRGLSAGGRQGAGREKYRSNDQELQRIEGQNIDPKKIENFEKEADLNQGR